MSWLPTSVIKIIRTTSIYALLNINLFLQQKLLTNTCHIMVPLCRYFLKDSKKYLFAILGFFFLRFANEFPSSLQKFKNKTNIVFRPLCFAEGPLKRIGNSCFGPWPGNRGGAEWAGRLRRAMLAGGEGDGVVE